MSNGTNPFDWRDLWGFCSVAVGAVAIVLTVVILLAFGLSQTNLTAVLGVIVSPIVAIVSAYFGVSASSKGATQAMNAQKSTSDTALASVTEASNKLYRAALAVDPNSVAGKALVDQEAGATHG
ncbi:MAG TPA: hypothetical protein VEK76_03670 [Candidatus Binatia bacterium]|nr:hypothetical protein [Candidatus Binatia bacterium]